MIRRAELEKQAAVLGIKPTSVRQRHWRAKVREETKFTPPSFETFGMKVKVTYLEDVRKSCALIHLILTHVRALTRELGRVRKAKTPMPRHALTELEDAAYELERRIAAAMPAALCPWCKGLDAVQPDCRQCDGEGLVSVSMLSRAPEELTTEPARVWFEGKVLDVADFAADRARDAFGLDSA